MERLDKFLSSCGAGTRSQVKLYLKAGRVSVDGVPEKDGGRKIDPAVNRICMDGEDLQQTGLLVVMLNKPAGFITATQDKTERTVMELLSPALRSAGVKPVGRLDKQTEGLLLFTNDGDLLHRLISPGKGIEKEYIAQHEGCAGAEDVEAFARGITLADGTQCLSAVLEPLGPGKSRVILHEGKYHQVRRMLASRQLPVTYLERVREGKLTLQGLSRGSFRILTPEEIVSLEDKTEL